MIFETFVKKNDGGRGTAYSTAEAGSISWCQCAEDLIKGVVYHPQMCVKPLLDQNILAAAAAPPASLSNSCTIVCV